MKRPVPINYALEGTINGERAVLWLFKYFTGHAGKVPDRIQSAIEDLFPGWQLSFKTTEDGNIILQVSETDQFGDIHSILPPSLPDGFFKLVLILTAVEMNPTILLIDEIENSLHESILDYLIDSLRDSHITTIITTHSPLVVNNVELSEIRILEREANGTKIKMINKPEEMKRKLLDMGITPSDFWLYGEIA
jgi:predicted ATPase